MRVSTVKTRPESGSAAIHCFLVLILLLTSVRQSLARYCLAEDNSPYSMFASKTSYEEVRGVVTEELKTPGCQPRLFYFLARHGTRYPNKKTIKKFNKVLPSLHEDILQSIDEEKAHLCDQDIENWRNWQLDLNESLHYELTTSGQQEMMDIASRFKQRLPDLLQTLFLPVLSKYDIKFSDTARSRDSAQYFLKGLTGQDFPLTDEMKDDRLLRAYKKCSRWQQEVNKNEEIQATINEYVEGPEMQQVVEDVRRRLGLDANFTYDEMDLMYEICRYEKSWNRSNISPWCAAFTKDHLQALEYAEDLKYYIEDGYGHAITYEQLCLPVQDIITHFRQAMKSDISTSPQVILRFSHSGFLLKLFARLGLYQDEKPLTADNHRKHADRQWKTSSIDPFSANLALVLWSCNNDHQISAFVNEHEIRLPHCSTFPCPISAFLNAYAPIADDCDVDATCALAGQAGGADTPSNVALTTSLALGFLALLAYCLRP